MITQKFKTRFWRKQDWEEQINRIINLTNIARITILFTLMLFSAFASESTELVKSLTEQGGNVSSIPVMMTNLQTRAMKIWFFAYGFLTMIGTFYPSWQKQNRWETPNITAVADISMMVLLTHLLGGVSTGFGILVLPFLAISCVLSYGRYPNLYASYASLLIIISLFLHHSPFEKDAGWFFSTLTNYLVLIASCYLVSLLTAYSASYLNNASESVQKHRTAFNQISALNKVVLNRMQEAVIVVDETRRVWLHNRQALHYFPTLKVNQTAPFVHELVRRWRGNSRLPFETNLMINQSDMNIRAIPVIQQETELLILFIRAEKERQAEAQSVKLASLGLLTANLAHEIRNPLSAARQANGLLIEMAEDDAMTNKLCHIIDNNIARIDRMIEEVSTLNKSDRLNRETISLKEFWQNFQQEFLLTRPEAAGCLKADIASKTDAIFDPMHLQQIVWNLCNNAWRHSQKKINSVKVVVRNEINSDFVSFRVYDDGEPIDDEKLSHLFEPFFTTQNVAEGTGLGLYVARELAHANRGDLNYIAKPKAFELLLPKARYD